MTIFFEVSENDFVRARPHLSKAISGKGCEIGCKLVLFTYRKSRTGFRLVPKSATLNDLARRNDRRSALSLQ